MHHRLSRVALLALLTSACGVNSLLNKIENESDETVDQVCSCTNVFPDRAMCEAQFNISLTSFVERDCLEDALDLDKDASKATLKCTLDVEKSYNDCLKKNLDCNDPNSFQTCNDNLSFDACPELPQNVQEAINACGGGNND